MIASAQSAWAHLPDEAVQFLNAIGRLDLEAVRFRGFRHKNHASRGGGRKGGIDTNLNEWQATGHSVYTVINRGGDTDDSITEAVAVFLEWDDRPLEAQLAFDWHAFGFPAPAVQVFSGGKSLHCYWPLSEPCTDLARWRQVMERMIRVFQSDRAIKNPSRVMRLPGYRYALADGSLGEPARLEQCHSRTFDLDALESALSTSEQRMEPQPPQGTQPLRPVPRTNVLDFPPRLQLEQLLTLEHKGQLASGVGEGERNVTAYALAVDAIACAGELNRQGIPYDGEPQQLLEAFARRCSPPLDDPEVRQVLASAQKQSPEVHQGFQAQLDFLLGQRKTRSNVGFPGGDRLQSDPLARAADASDQQRRLADVHQQIRQRIAAGDSDAELQEFINGFGRDAYNLRLFVQALRREQQEQHTTDEQLQQAAALEQAHQQIRQLVEDGAGDVEVQAFINAQGGNSYGLRKFADAVRQQMQEVEEARESVARLMRQDDVIEPTVAAYLPEEFQHLTQILREGLSYPEPAIVMTILVAVTALLRPDIRVRALSFEQPCILWLFLVAGSGVGKTPLLNSLVLAPIQRGVLVSLHESNQQRIQEWQQQSASAEKEKKDPPPKPRRRNCIVTGITTQGIRADMAANGADSPMFLVKDELSSWLKEMATAKDTTADVGFFLSAYDGAYSNDVLADENRCREVKQGKLSVIGGIQPEVFEEYLPKGIENGFNTRPLFVHLPRVPKAILDGDLNRLVCTLAKLYEAAFEGRGLAPGAVYTPTPLAKAAFVEFFRQTDARGMEANSSAVDAIWQKANGQVLRVAAGLQFLRDFYEMEDLEPPSGDPLRPRISFDTMTLAIQLVVAGKTTSVAIHERATNPQAAMAVRFMEKARGLQLDQWVHLGEFAKSCWDSRKRPKRPQLLELARGLHLAGQIRLSPDEKTFSLGRGA